MLIPEQSSAQQCSTTWLRIKQLPAGLLLIVCLFLAGALYLFILRMLDLFGVFVMSLGSYLLQGYEVVGPPVFFLSAALCGLTAWGLLTGRKWSGWTARIIAAWLVVSSAWAISSALGEWRLLALAFQGAKLVFAITVFRSDLGRTPSKVAPLMWHSGT